MADEILKRDGNHVTVIGAVTDDAAQEVRMVRVDPITNRILASITGMATGTVTSVAAGTGILATPDPITTTGTISLSTTLQPAATLTGNALKFLRVNAGETAVEYATVAAGLTVGSTSIASGTTTRVLYDNAGVLGEYTISGSGNVAMTTSPVFTTPNIGSATGSVSGNAGTATALQNARTIGGVSFDGTANITVATATGGFTVSGGNLALGTNSVTLTGSIAATGARVTKGWFTDIESTNMPTVGGTAILTSLTAPSFTTIELGAGGATDTTLARVSAGVISVEGVRVITSAGTTANTILKNNGTTFVASTETYAAPGTSGNVMTSDGTNWTSAAPAAGGGGWTLVYSTTFTGASVTVNNNGSNLAGNTDEIYMLVVKGVFADGAEGSLQLRMNNDSSGTYYFVSSYTDQASGMAATTGAGDTKINITNGSAEDLFTTLTIFAKTSNKKQVTGTANIFDTSSNTMRTFTVGGLWEDTSTAITAFTLLSGGGDFTTGSKYWLYKKS